jgi:hypothetical protein
MTPVEQGRHCKVCSKNVIDFTSFSDEKLLDFLSTPQQNICGRFKSKQLNREISTPQEPKQYSLPSTWLFGLSLLAGTVATALPVPTYATPTVIEQSLEHKVNKTPNGDSTRVIKGIVTDSTTNERLAFVTIRFKEAKIGVATDLDGKFLLKIPENYANKDLSLEIRYIGYKTKYLIVKPEEKVVKVMLSEKKAISCTTGLIISHQRTVITSSDSEALKKERKIFGSVLSKEDDSPLMEAIISIQGTKYKTETDFQGNFSFNFPPSYFDSTFTLEIKMIGYSTLLITDYSYKFATKPLTIKLKESAIIVGTFYRPTRWQRIKGFFRRLF